MLERSFIFPVAIARNILFTVKTVVVILLKNNTGNFRHTLHQIKLILRRFFIFLKIYGIHSRRISLKSIIICLSGNRIPFTPSLSKNRITLSFISNELFKRNKDGEFYLQLRPYDLRLSELSLDLFQLRLKPLSWAICEMRPAVWFPEFLQFLYTSKYYCVALVTVERVFLYEQHGNCRWFLWREF